MRRPVVVSVALLLLACSSETRPEGAPAPSLAVAGAIPTSTPPPASPTPAPTITASRPADGTRASIFLVDWPNGAASAVGGALRPIDPSTGQDIAGYAPHDPMQAASIASLSPDGGHLVLTIAVSGSAPGSKLVTVDLGSWTMREHLRSSTYPSGFAWSKDSRAVYFRDGPQGAALSRLDVAAGIVTTVAKANFWAASPLYLSADERAIYLLGHASSDARANIQQGDPLLARLDIASGLFASVPLRGLAAGQVRPETPGREAGYYLPALALAPDGASAYIVDGATDRILTVDLSSMAVRDDRSLAKARPAWKRGLGWLGGQFVSTAHAKGAEYYTAAAAVTPDGRYLVAAATRDEWCGEPARPCASSKPAGLRVVELSSMRVVLRDESVGAFALSPDGRWVIGYASWYEEPADGALVQYRGSGLQVFDLREVRKAASLEPGAAVEAVVFDAVGGHAVALEVGPGLAADYNEGCPKPCYGLKAVELGASTRPPRVVAERSLDTRAVQLLPE